MSVSMTSYGYDRNDAAQNTRYDLALILFTRTGGVVIVNMKQDSIERKELTELTKTSMTDDFIMVCNLPQTS